MIDKIKYILHISFLNHTEFTYRLFIYLFIYLFIHLIIYLFI